MVGFYSTLRHALASVLGGVPLKMDQSREDFLELRPENAAKMALFLVTVALWPATFFVLRYSYRKGSEGRRSSIKEAKNLRFSVQYNKVRT